MRACLSGVQQAARGRRDRRPCERMEAHRRPQPTVSFLQSLLEDYSKRGLSEPTDRAVAISGLAARIASALDCIERYGIFGFCFHRNLLWQRTDPQKKKRIKYEAGKEVPSWSWMAYEEGIQFIQFSELPYRGLDVFKDLRFAQEKRALLTKVWEFQDCHLDRKAVPDARCRQILDSRGTERGWIMYDAEDRDALDGERAVVVGRTYRSTGPDGREYYYILVARRRAGMVRRIVGIVRWGVGSEYERVGIGRIQQGYVSRQEADVFIV
ncbi:hypothetical protein F5883DRAFT_255648 [Diaporthe sp. PMI_573]|nr:hypothetical protein F5883DRAFT_255648 [Diaporthaceae sp. PMI_573]